MTSRASDATPDQIDWTVLLIGGNSGIGKSALAERLGLRLGIPWLMVDDLRLALQRSRAILPAGSDALHYFADIAAKPHIWQQPPETLRDALIGTAEALSPALEARARPLRQGAHRGRAEDRGEDA